MGSAVIVSCEHGGNTVPRRYAALFDSAGPVLAGHRAYDPGALDLASELSRRLGAPLIASRTTRLLVEVNRSPHHPRLFSEYSRVLGPDERIRVLERYYFSYRGDLEGRIAAQVRRRRRVIHLSVHSFTPRVQRVVRKADIGLLYDPARHREVTFCVALKHTMRELCPHAIVRRNYPYRGNSDGLTTYLRTRFPPSAYLGIELEVNQKHLDRRRRTGGRPRIRAAVVAALEHALRGKDSVP